MPPKAEKKNNGFDRLRADLKAQTPQNVYRSTERRRICGATIWRSCTGS